MTGICVLIDLYQDTVQCRVIAMLIHLDQDTVVASTCVLIDLDHDNLQWRVFVC